MQSFRKGDIVVHKVDPSQHSTAAMLFYVEGNDVWCGDGKNLLLTQVTSHLGWNLDLPQDELEVVGHVDGDFVRKGSCFRREDMPSFAKAIAEAKRRGYPIRDEWCY